MENAKQQWRIYTLADRVWDYKYFILGLDILIVIILLVLGDEIRNILLTMLWAFILLVTQFAFWHLLTRYYLCPCGQVSPSLLGECANCSRPMPHDL